MCPADGKQHRQHSASRHRRRHRPTAMGTRGPVSQPWQSHCAHDTRTHRRHCLPITEHLAPAAAAQCPPGTPTPPTSASPSSPVASRTLPVLPHHLEGGQKGASPCSPHQPIAQSARTPCNETLQLQPTTQLQSHQPAFTTAKEPQEMRCIANSPPGLLCLRCFRPHVLHLLGDNPTGTWPLAPLPRTGTRAGSTPCLLHPRSPPSPSAPTPRAAQAPIAITSSPSPARSLWGCEASATHLDTTPADLSSQPWVPSPSGDRIVPTLWGLL